MSNTSKLVEKDHGWLKAKNNLKKLKGSTVDIGVLQNAPAYPDGTSMAQVAFYNEYGTETKAGETNIPERPFIRKTADDNTEKYAKRGKKEMLKVLQGKSTISQSLGKMGLAAASDVKKTIKTLSEPANAPATIEKKGSSNPLVDTGFLMKSIDYEVNA